MVFLLRVLPFLPPPTNGSANKQLVTDGEGNTKWEDRICYTTDPVETVLLEEQTVTITGEDEEFYEALEGYLLLEEGKTYTVNFNGASYECVAWYHENFGLMCIGNGSLREDDVHNSEDPFCVDSEDGTDIYLTTGMAGTYTIKISILQSHDIQINQKYIPNYVTDEEKNIWNTSMHEVKIYPTLPVKSTWHKITYGRDKFIAIANGENMAYSIDGIVWTQIEVPFSTVGWYDIVYGNGKFVALALNGIAAYSAGGITWKKIILPVKLSDLSIVYGNDKFVAVGNNLYNTNKIALYSEDGITWNQTNLPSEGAWVDIAYGNGKFVAVNGDTVSAYSTDGITWTQITLPAKCQYITYGNDKFVGFPYNGSTAIYSTDGINWEAAELPIAWTFNALCYGDGKFIAVGYYNNVKTVTLYSEAGTVWRQIDFQKNNCMAITYGDGKFVAIDYFSSKVIYSQNGIHWENKYIYLENASGEDITSDVELAVGIQYKQNKIIGNYGQIVGFDDNGNAVAQEMSSMILKSSTASSTKKFKITVDDSGTISATEVT